MQIVAYFVFKVQPLCYGGGASKLHLYAEDFGEVLGGLFEVTAGEGPRLAEEARLGLDLGLGLYALKVVAVTGEVVYLVNKAAKGRGQGEVRA